jgi:hypothetical protein
MSTIITLTLLALAQPAFAGWYLMVPPLVETSTGSDATVSLFQWHQVGSYDSAYYCNYARDRLTEYAKTHNPPGRPDQSLTRKQNSSTGQNLALRE